MRCSTVGLFAFVCLAASSGVGAAQEHPAAAVSANARIDTSDLFSTPAVQPTESRAVSLQALQPAGPPPTPRHTGVHAMMKDIVEDVKHLPSKENAVWAGVAGGLALAVHPIDDNVRNGLAYDHRAQNFFKLGKYLGQSYVLIPVAAAVYVYGRTKDEPKVSHVGMDLLEALLIAEGMTQTLKYTTRRERPDGSGKTSFPSGHSADTFAFATAFERHIGWKGAVPAYIFASYVAISRLPDNRHWLSDTVFGAGVGIIAGRTVTRHGAKYPFTVAAVRGGAEIMFVRSN